MQPTFLPWIGYFDLIDKVDKFVFYDDVQLSKRSWQTRNKIRTREGEKLISGPILKTKSRSNLFICDAKISYDHKWKKKHLLIIEHNYSKSKYFKEIFSFIESIYQENFLSLSKFNQKLITEISKNIGIKSKFILSSELDNINGKKDIRLVSICKRLGMDAYLSPLGSSDYIELNSPGGEFTKNKIDLYYHNYNHPKYQQQFDNFISHISIVDLLFNYGFTDSLKIIKEGRLEDYDYLTFRKNFINK